MRNVSCNLLSTVMKMKKDHGHAINPPEALSRIVKEEGTNMLQRDNAMSLGDNFLRETIQHIESLKMPR